MQILKSDPNCWELSRTLDINHFIFEVGSRKSEVGSPSLAFVLTYSIQLKFNARKIFTSL